MILSKNKFNQNRFNINLISGLIFGLIINVLLAAKFTECAPAAGNNVVVVSMQEIMQISELGGKKHQSLTKLQTDKMAQIQKKQQDFEPEALFLRAFLIVIVLVNNGPLFCRPAPHFFHRNRPFLANSTPYWAVWEQIGLVQSS